MNLPLAISRLRGDNRVPQTFWNKLPIVGSSRSQATMDALREMYTNARSQATMDAVQEMYAKVDELDKEIAEYDDNIRVCRELLETKIENQNTLVQQRKFWLDRIAYHRMLDEYLRSKAAERKAQEEAERKAEEQAAREASAKEEADNAAKKRPTAKTAIARKKQRTRER